MRFRQVCVCVLLAEDGFNNLASSSALCAPGSFVYLPSSTNDEAYLDASSSCGSYGSSMLFPDWNTPPCVLMRERRIVEHLLAVYTLFESARHLVAGPSTILVLHYLGTHLERSLETRAASPFGKDSDPVTWFVTKKWQPPVLPDGLLVGTFGKGRFVTKLHDLCK